MYGFLYSHQLTCEEAGNGPLLGHKLSITSRRHQSECGISMSGGGGGGEREGWKREREGERHRERERERERERKRSISQRPNLTQEHSKGPSCPGLPLYRVWYEGGPVSSSLFPFLYLHRPLLLSQLSHQRHQYHPGLCHVKMVVQEVMLLLCVCADVCCLCFL